MDVSLFKIHSLGRVAANKELNSWEIEVTPIEDLPHLDGELTSDATPIATKATDAKGGSYDDAMVTANTLPATWLPVGQPNRMTPPDVRRGEEVVLYRYGDSQKLYWNTTRNDMRFRKLETVVFGISGTTEEGGMDQNKMYFLEFSSHKGVVHLHMSKANDEFVTWDMKFDGTNGMMEIMDDLGNFFRMNSKDTIIRMENAEGTYIEMNKKEMFQFAVDKIHQQARDIVVECETYTNTASQSHTTKTTTMSEEASAGKSTRANVSQVGSLAMKGNLQTLPGENGETGEGRFAGSMTFEENVNVEGTLTATHITTPNDISAPNV